MSEVYTQAVEEVAPEDIWDFFKAYEDDLEEEDLLLYIDFDNEVQIFAGIDGYGDKYLRVTDLDDIEYERLFIQDKEDAEETLREMIDVYLIGHDELLEDQDFDEPPSFHDKIIERDRELDMAFYDLLYVVLNKDVEEEIMEDIKDKVLEYIAGHYPEYRIYHPMILDVNGVDTYSEYPYEEYEIM